MVFIWLLGGLSTVVLVSWIGSRILRAVIGPVRERAKTPGHDLGEAEQLTRNPKV